MKQIANIDSEAVSWKYIGLPTVVCRSKEGCFKYIGERSSAKVSHCKGQGLPKKGREVYVKFVHQASPTFAMSFFHFTNKLCRNLKSISSNFWWGAGQRKRKVHWIAWEKMCRRKQVGGMGFRDYEAFNKALLAKQAWRILTVPNSLYARVLKARHFPRFDFMEASFPKSASATWKGIIRGCHLLHEGLMCQVGDGSKIKVWTENWIPMEGTMNL